MCGISLGMGEVATSDFETISTTGEFYFEARNVLRRLVAFLIIKAAFVVKNHRWPFWWIISFTTNWGATE